MNRKELMTTLFGRPVFFMACFSIPDVPEPNTEEYLKSLFKILIGEEKFFTLDLHKRIATEEDVRSLSTMNEWTKRMAQAKSDSVAWDKNMFGAQLGDTPFSCLSCNWDFESLYRGMSVFLDLPHDLPFVNFNVGSMAQGRRKFLLLGEFIDLCIQAFNRRRMPPEIRRRFLEVRNLIQE